MFDATYLKAHGTAAGLHYRGMFPGAFAVKQSGLVGIIPAPAGRSFKCGFSGQHVTHVSHRYDHIGMRRGVGQFFAQFVNMDIDAAVNR